MKTEVIKTLHHTRCDIGYIIDELLMLSADINEFITDIDVMLYGKEMHFEQNDGMWYSRISDSYLNLNKVLNEIKDEIIIKIGVE